MLEQLSVSKIKPLKRVLMTDHYEYKGTNEYAKHFAIAQLHENPQKVNDHIERFRKWVESMPHLICPKDSKFLLRFLRVAKFDHKKAQERLDNFCTSRGDLECFEYPKMDNPMVTEYLEKRIGLPLGSTDSGEIILLLRPTAWNPDTVSLKKTLMMTFMTLDILVEEEEAQIYGIRFLIDYMDMSRKAIVAASDPKALKNLNRIWHESFPMRLKNEVFYNESELSDHISKMYTHYMDPRMKKRISRKVNDFETLIEIIPGVEKILPTEYGGEAGPMSEMADRAKKQFKEYYKNGDPLANVGVDESKRPEGARYFCEYGEYEGPVLEME